MNDREKMVDLMADIIDFVDWEHLEETADYLIANGVVVLPCKVGETVYFLRGANKPELIETIIEKIVVKNKGYYMKLACNSMYETSCNSIGKTVFYSKEEALAKMKEINNGR